MTTYLQNAGQMSMPQAFTFDDAEKAYGVAVHNTRRHTPRGGPVSLGGNTTIRRDGKDIVVRLHKTDIIRYHPDDSITLNSGGYLTATTKGRINAFLSPFIGLHQHKREWVVTSGAMSVPFYDGIHLFPIESRDVRGKARKNPGKFDSDMDRYMYHLSMDGTDEDISFADNWYGRMNNVTFLDVVRAAEDEGEDEHSARNAWRKELGTGWRRDDTIGAVILHEDSNGFLYVGYYRDEREADKRWNEIVAESEEYEE